MGIHKDIFFHQITTEMIIRSVVILDIDGTLTCSSRCDIDDKVLYVIRELQKKNTVYIFSNNYNGTRSRNIAHDLNLPYIEAPHKKPNKKILDYIDTGTSPVIAIGDKYLTDGLFAHFIGAHYIRVRRYRAIEDSYIDKATCLFDDCVYMIARFLRVTK